MILPSPSNCLDIFVVGCFMTANLMKNQLKTCFERLFMMTFNAKNKHPEVH